MYKITSEMIKDELRKDCISHNLETGTEVTNFFYSNYADSNKFSEFLLFSDRHTNTYDKFDTEKKINFLAENRLNVLKDNLIDLYEFQTVDTTSGANPWPSP